MISGLKKLLLGGVFFGALAGFSPAQADEITLAWDENTETNLEGYLAFKREGGGVYDYNNPAWKGSETTCIVGDLNESIPYCFVVRAINTLGQESGNSNEVCYTENLSRYVALPSQSDTWQFIDSYGSFNQITGLDGRVFAEVLGSDANSKIKIPIYALNLYNWDNPMLLISAENTEEVQPIEVMLEDSDGNQASYSALGDNFFQGNNYLMLNVDNPSIFDDNFDSRNIKDVYLSGPSHYNLEYLAIMPGGKTISGNLLEGVNAFDVNNYADFSNQDNNRNDITGLAGRLTRIKRYVECNVENLDIDLAQNSELLSMFSLSQSQYNGFPASAIQLNIGGESHIINKSELNVGFNTIKKPINSLEYVTSATILFNHITSLSTITPITKLENLYIGACE